MKRLFTILFLLSLFTNINAQFDTEHWFAPFANQNNLETEQYLYLSTNTSTPFKVEIYNNNFLCSKALYFYLLILDILIKRIRI
jgi:hypothetical protein